MFVKHLIVGLCLVALGTTVVVSCVGVAWADEHPIPYGKCNQTALGCTQYNCVPGTYQCPGWSTPINNAYLYNRNVPHPTCGYVTDPTSCISAPYQFCHTEIWYAVPPGQEYPCNAPAALACSFDSFEAGCN
jgi:hypothetical protein